MEKTIESFLRGKPELTLDLFAHFKEEFQKVGPVTLHPAKTMIGIATGGKRIAYITQLGKDFIHVVFPFEESYHQNLCFQKIARVRGRDNQFNHHFRMLAKADVTAEVKKFMKLAVSRAQ